MHENTLVANQPKSNISAVANEVALLHEPQEPETGETLRLPIQLKLSVGAANDPLEYEADAMADKVMRMPENSFIQRKSGCSCGSCSTCDDEHVRLKPLSGQITPFIQTKSDGAGTVSNSVSSRIQSSMGGGSPMQNDTKSFMESRFGADFSNVKIHNGGESAELNRSLNARAFTVSNNIYFNSGQYQPETDTGKHLLAHELTHVVQQGAAVGLNDIQQKRTAPDSTIMRSKLYNSTINICHRVLKSRTFHVSNGGVRVNLYISEPDLKITDCKNHPFHLTLTNVKSWYKSDVEISDCKAETGKNTTLKIGNLSDGDYYFTFWRTFDHPYCCVDGEVEVFDEHVGDSSGCEIIKQKTTLEMVHDVLDAAGFIPVLGAVPDGINALIYTTEGDWTNAGISAIAMIPEFGDAASLVLKGEKTMLKIEAKAALKLDEKAVVKSLKEAKAASKEAKAVTKETEKVAASGEKAVEKEADKVAEKEAKERAEKEAKKKAEKEAKEKAEKEAKEKAEKEAKEKAEKEAKEKAEKEAKEKAEKEAKEKAEKEAKEKAEKEAKEKAEKEAKEKAEKEAKEKAEKEAKEKAEKEAKEKAEKEAKALKEKIAKCLAIYATKAALGTCPGCKPTDNKTTRATKIACLTAEIAARRAYLNEDCDDYLQGSIDRKNRGEDPKRGHNIQLTEKIASLAKCATMPFIP